MNWDRSIAAEATVAIRQALETPRFQQIADHISNSIAVEQLPAHTPLPSERTIAEDHGVSRMTARRALEALEAQGLVYSEDRRGRFVSPQRVRYDVSNMVSFVANAQASGTKLEIEVISSGNTRSNPVLARHLGVKSGEPVFEYTRLFRSRGYAIFVETEYVLANRFPKFLDCDLRQSTTHILEQHYDTSPRSGDIVIRMRGVGKDEARLLGLATSQSGIELEQVICDDAGVPFCFGRQLWRGELAEFSAHAIMNR